MNELASLPTRQPDEKAIKNTGAFGPDTSANKRDPTVPRGPRNWLLFPAAAKFGSLVVIDVVMG